MFICRLPARPVPLEPYPGFPLPSLPVSAPREFFSDRAARGSHAFNRNQNGEKKNGGTAGSKKQLGFDLCQYMFMYSIHIERKTCIHLYIYILGMVKKNMHIIMKTHAFIHYIILDGQKRHDMG